MKHKGGPNRPGRGLMGVSALVMAAAVCVPQRVAAHDFSEHEWRQVQAKPLYLVDDYRPTWPGAVVPYRYNPAGQPASLSTAQMEAILQQAARRWENVCNVRFVYLGTTERRPDLDATFSTIDRENVIGWDVLTGDRAGYSGYVRYWRVSTPEGKQLVDADMVLNIQGKEPIRNGDPVALSGLVTHEMGHMLAIRHSDQPQSVMFANPYNTYSYQNTLRGDDAAACASLYGPAPRAAANRVFNWAERQFPELFAPFGATSVDGGGFHYRFYPATQSYLGVKDGQVWYMGQGQGPTAVGRVEDFLPAAVQAGF